MRIRALLLALAFVLLACERPGGDSEGPERGNSFGLCDLLTTDEVERVTGEAVTKMGVESSHQPGVRLCVYKLGKRWGSIAVHSLDDAPALYDRLITEQPMNVEQVDGIGDRALIHAVSSIVVVEGDSGFGINVQYGAQEGTEAVLKSLARLAVERI